MAKTKGKGRRVWMCWPCAKARGLQAMLVPGAGPCTGCGKDCMSMVKLKGGR